MFGSLGRVSVDPGTPHTKDYNLIRERLETMLRPVPFLAPEVSLLLDKSLELRVEYFKDSEKRVDILPPLPS